MSMFKNVNVVYYYVRDWEAAKKFYGDVLGWPLAWASDEAGWVQYGRDNETHIAINRWTASEPMPGNGGATVTFSVDNAYETTAALRAKGVRCDDVVEIPGIVVLGTFYDPDGNRLQFAQSAPPPA